MIPDVQPGVFWDSLWVTPDDNGKVWTIVDHPFIYSRVEGKVPDSVRVPVGFLTDFASIPRALWTTVGGPWGLYGWAAVLHDFLYTVQTTDKDTADMVLLEVMKLCGTPSETRDVIYEGVHLFGDSAWKCHSKIKENAKNDPKFNTLNNDAFAVALSELGWRVPIEPSNGGTGDSGANEPVLPVET